ncbi:unnamed protein product, partial [Ectocarpus fasciculatus]
MLFSSALSALIFPFLRKPGVKPYWLVPYSGFRSWRYCLPLGGVLTREALCLLPPLTLNLGEKMKCSNNREQTTDRFSNQRKRKKREHTMDAASSLFITIIVIARHKIFCTESIRGGRGEVPRFCRHAMTRPCPDNASKSNIVWPPFANQSTLTARAMHTPHVMKPSSRKNARERAELTTRQIEGSMTAHDTSIDRSIDHPHNSNTHLVYAKNSSSSSKAAAPSCVCILTPTTSSQKMKLPEGNNAVGLPC